VTIAPATVAPAVVAGVMEIEFVGGARLRISGAVEPAMVSAAVAALHAAMTIPIPSGTRVWLATGHTDMCKGFDGLISSAALTQRRQAA
jgi:hypothetical protein